MGNQIRTDTIRGEAASDLTGRRRSSGPSDPTPAARAHRRMSQPRALPCRPALNISHRFKILDIF
jgi:hypothetical protein